jgi:hypothetical protein
MTKSRHHFCEQCGSQRYRVSKGFGGTLISRERYSRQSSLDVAGIYMAFFLVARPSLRSPPPGQGCQSNLGTRQYTFCIPSRSCTTRSHGQHSRPVARPSMAAHDRRRLIGNATRNYTRTSTLSDCCAVVHACNKTRRRSRLALAATSEAKGARQRPVRQAWGHESASLRACCSRLRRENLRCAH